MSGGPRGTSARAGRVRDVPTSDPVTPPPPSEPLALTMVQRVVLGIIGGLFAVAGLTSLLLQRQNGAATLAVLVAGAVLGFIAVVGQIPGTTWTRFARAATDELRHFRALRNRITADEVLRAVAQAAATQQVQVQFGAEYQAWVWDALLTAHDGREIGVTYVGSDSALPDHFDKILSPERRGFAILVVFGDTLSNSDRWNIVSNAALQGGHRMSPATAGDAATARLRVSVCGSTFGEIYQHLDTLVADRTGGTGQNTEVHVIN